ncbi:rRNA-processing protein and EBNA1-binding protein ebp2 [Orobanche gracilis]
MPNNQAPRGLGIGDGDPLVSESESESSEEEDVKLSEPSKTAVNNKAALLDKLGDISWPQNIDWIHKLSLDIDHDQEIDVNDDLTRELAFYTQALDGARQAFGKFQSMGLPFLRPSDYYAEMVKTDTHMEKVKGRLLAEKRRTEEAEERRKARDNKKLSKEIQAQKLKERAKQKKEDIESVKNWRKQRKQSGFAEGEDGDFSLAFEDGKSFERSGKKRPGVGPGDRSGGKGRQSGGGGGGKGGKKGGFDKKRKEREIKDSKFGFGGRKGSKKQNTAETTNDFRAFRKSDSPKNKKRKV